MQIGITYIVVNGILSLLTGIENYLITPQPVASNRYFLETQLKTTRTGPGTWGRLYRAL